MIDLSTENEIAGYEEVRRHFCREIAEGRLRPGEHLESPEEISQNLKIGVGTVRHALQRLASSGILVRKRRVGSIVSMDAVSRVKGWSISCSHINVVIPQNPLPESMACMQGIQATAANYGVTVTISSAHNEPEQFHRTIKEQLDSGVGGFLVMTSLNYNNIPFKTISMIRESKLPVVCYQGVIPGLDTYSVTQNHVANMEKVVAHLLEIGRKKITFIGFDDPKNPFAFKSSHYDFLSVSQKLGLVPDFNRKIQITIPKKPETLLPESSHWYEEIETWLKKHDDTDAFCCSFDRIAWAAIRAVEDMGMRVPEDIAVTGMGLLNPYYGLPTDDLTTVGVCAEEMGRKACRILLDACSGNPPANFDECKLTGTLLVGRSTIGKAVRN